MSLCAANLDASMACEYRLRVVDRAILFFLSGCEVIPFGIGLGALGRRVSGNGTSSRHHLGPSPNPFELRQNAIVGAWHKEL